MTGIFWIKGERMRINEHHVKRCVSQLLGILFFAALFCVASDCQAQRHRGWFKRSAHANHGTRQQVDRIQQAELENSRSPLRLRKSASSDPDNRQTSPSNDAFEPYPKFIGGFHSSHFSNLGIPTGDLGFRGNGVYWAPW